MTEIALARALLAVGIKLDEPRRTENKARHEVQRDYVDAIHEISGPLSDTLESYRRRASATLSREEPSDVLPDARKKLLQLSAFLATPSFYMRLTSPSARWTTNLPDFIETTTNAIGSVSLLWSEARRERETYELIKERRDSTPDELQSRAKAFDRADDKFRRAVVVAHQASVLLEQRMVWIRSGKKKPLGPEEFYADPVGDLA